MMMCYNFFVGMCSRCSELIQIIDKIYTLIYIISMYKIGQFSKLTGISIFKHNPCVFLPIKRKEKPHK